MTFLSVAFFAGKNACPTHGIWTISTWHRHSCLWHFLRTRIPAPQLHLIFFCLLENLRQSKNQPRLFITNLFCIGVILLVASQSSAHEIRPCYLEMTVLSDEIIDILWKVPVVQDMKINVQPIFPSTCQKKSQVATERLPEALIERWQIDCGKAGLTGKTILVSGLSETLTDVFVRIRFSKHAEITKILRSDQPLFLFPDHKIEQKTMLSALKRGCLYLLQRKDLILLWLTLSMIQGRLKTSIKNLVDFMLVHALGVTLVFMNVFNPKPIVLDAMIASGILVLTVELARRTSSHSTPIFNRLWVIILILGLLYGFTAAKTHLDGALKAGSAMGIFLFHIGAITGIAIFVSVIERLQRHRKLILKKWPKFYDHALLYAVGSLASFGFILRLMAFFPS